MKTNSNIQFPKTARWKDGETVIYVNHKDNGVQTEGEEGKRYEADFTIVKDTDDITGAIEAFTRMTTDPVQDQLVVDNIEIGGTLAIDIKKEYATKVSSTIFPPLPSSGTLKVGEIYSYGSGAVMVRQTHERTIYTPEQTPALFSFWRDNASAELAWMDGENVEKGWKRTFGGKTYECLQAHQTQADWTPTATIGVLWKEVVVIPADNAWAVGIAYKVGDIVTYLGKRYSCRQAHTSISTWTPTAAASLWLLIV